MKRLHSKKGLSPIIATVLLIALVMVLASIVFLWARGFVTEHIEKFEQPVENVCSSADFEVEIIPSGYGSDTLEVVNKGNVNIYHLEIKMFDSQGNSEITKFKFNVDSGASTSGEVPLTMSDGTRPSKITIYPALVGNVVGESTNKVYTCLESGKSITL